MKPKNKFQQHVLELSKRLPKITEPQQRWAFKHCFDHIGKRNAKGTITCLECGHKWHEDNSPLADAVLGCKCPNCATQLKINTTRQRVFKNIEYFGIITTCGGFQVIRYFHISVYRKAGEQARYSCSEVVQRWLSPNGKDGIDNIVRRLGERRMSVSGFLGISNEAGAEAARRLCPARRDKTKSKSRQPPFRNLPRGGGAMETTVNRLCIVSKLSTQLLETTSYLRFWGASLCFGQTETTCSTYPVGVEEKSRWSNH